MCLSLEPKAEDSVCDCGESMRSACLEEPFYKEREGKRYCVLHFPSRQKSVDFNKALQRKLENKDFNFQGVWFPDELCFSECDFTTEVSFRNAIFRAKADFRCAIFRAEADFRYAIFRAEADFRYATFKAEVYFDHSTFNAAASFHYTTFSTTFFSNATFSDEADFSDSTVSAAFFKNTTFGATADFSDTKFNSTVTFARTTFRGLADFSSATFAAAEYFAAAADFSYAMFKSTADFSEVSFSSTRADFTDVTLEDYVKFTGYEKRLAFGGRSALDLRFARIGKPDRVSFHSLTLHPNWFVNVDPRKFDFTDVSWNWRSVKDEVKILEDNNVSSPYRFLAITYRHLAVNAEENNRYEEASRFRYLAMDTRRLKWVEKLQGNFFHAHWKALQKALLRLIRSFRRDVGVRAPLIRLKRFVGVYWRDFSLLHWFYWALSGYGERVFRASIVLLVVWLLFAGAYTRVGFVRWEARLVSERDLASVQRDKTGAPLSLNRALTYSAGVMTLQKPEPRPATTTAQAMVLFETILGPVQAALLALAVRRRFMR